MSAPEHGVVLGAAHRGDLGARLTRFASRARAARQMGKPLDSFLKESGRDWVRAPVRLLLPATTWDELERDLALALQPGYGLDRADMLGQVSPDGPTVQPRRGLWAAGHEGPYRPERVAGTLLAAGPAVRAGAALTRPTLADLAPTFLAGLGLPSPAEMDGQPLKEAFWGNLTNGSDVS